MCACVHVYMCACVLIQCKSAAACLRVSMRVRERVRVCVHVCVHGRVPGRLCGLRGWLGLGPSSGFGGAGHTGAVDTLDPLSLSLGSSSSSIRSFGT